MAQQPPRDSFSGKTASTHDSNQRKENTVVVESTKRSPTFTVTNPTTEPVPLPTAAPPSAPLPLTLGVPLSLSNIFPGYSGASRNFTPVLAPPAVLAPAPERASSSSRPSLLLPEPSARDKITLDSSASSSAVALSLRGEISNVSLADSAISSPPRRPTTAHNVIRLRHSPIITRDQIVTSVESFLAQAVSAGFISAPCAFSLNYVVSLTGTVTGRSLIWVDSNAIYNILLGKSPEGRTRVEYRINSNADMSDTSGTPITSPTLSPINTPQSSRLWSASLGSLTDSPEPGSDKELRLHLNSSHGALVGLTGAASERTRSPLSGSTIGSGAPLSAQRESKSGGAKEFAFPPLAETDFGKVETINWADEGDDTYELRASDDGTSFSTGLGASAVTGETLAEDEARFLREEGEFDIIMRRTHTRVPLPPLLTLPPVVLTASQLERMRANADDNDDDIAANSIIEPEPVGPTQAHEDSQLNHVLKVTIERGDPSQLTREEVRALFVPYCSTPDGLLYHNRSICRGEPLPIVLDVVMGNFRVFYVAYKPGTEDAGYAQQMLLIHYYGNYTFKTVFGNTRDYHVNGLRTVAVHKPRYSRESDHTQHKAASASGSSHTYGGGRGRAASRAGRTRGESNRGVEYQPRLPGGEPVSAASAPSPVPAGGERTILGLLAAAGKLVDPPEEGDDDKDFRPLYSRRGRSRSRGYSRGGK